MAELAHQLDRSLPEVSESDGTGRIAGH